MVGSVALDSVKTPFGETREALGGSATYFSYAASFFSPVRMVAVVGDDFPAEHLDLLRKKGIQMEGVRVAKGKTFRWAGSYEYDLNQAHTLTTELNVFEHFRPEIPPAYRRSPYVFLANIHPELQRDVLRQVRQPQLVGCDTMNLWIKTERAALRELLKKVDILVINDGEARQWTEVASLVKAGRVLLEWGPRYVVIKKGEHGALLFGDGAFFSAPAFPLEEVYDPTGAGDCFAGGFFGFLAKSGGRLTEAVLRRAVVYGTVVASFNVEKFSLDRLKTLRLAEIEARARSLKKLTHFDLD